jgi:sigma-B regulation protein RsbU (phosphoserine phosphatase)
LQAGLTSLVAQEALVGLMVVHSTQGTSRLVKCLIQTFANQAALAIQRAGLVEQRAKIEALEAAPGRRYRRSAGAELELAARYSRACYHAISRSAWLPVCRALRACRQVAATWHDVIPLDGEHFGVAIADVSDKGMPAALYMALTRSLILAEARREASPGDVLRRINRLLLELSQPGMFVTVFYGVIDRAAGLLTFASAGHERPLLLRGGELLELAGVGNPLGILPDDEFEIREEAVALQPDDRLVLYTDGLADVVSLNGQLFDRARLKAIVQAHVDLLPEDLCEAVFAALLAYQGSGEQFDDMAMLVIRVVPGDQR